MIYSHFIGRVGAKDAQVINGHNGSFMAVDVAVDTYSKGVEKTMWIRVRSNRPNLVSLAKYLTRGKLLLIEGALGEPTVWTDKKRREPCAVVYQCRCHPFRFFGEEERYYGDRYRSKG